MRSVDADLSLLENATSPANQGNFKGWIPPPFILTEHSSFGKQVA